MTRISSMNPDPIIAGCLDAVAQAHDVTILFAVESGSRAWGFASPDSDFDVRFIYREPIDRMIRLFEPRQVIAETIEIPGLPPIDMVGWSLKKALQLGTASNPQFCEWCMRAPSYREAPGFREEMQAVAGHSSPRVLAHHYRGLARKTMASYLQKPGDPVAKKYLYAIRSTLSAAYMIAHPVTGVTPPILFEDLRAAVPSPASVEKDIDALLAFKATHPEAGGRRRFPKLDAWLKERQAQLVDAVCDLPDPMVPAQIGEAIHARHARIEIQRLAMSDPSGLVPDDPASGVCRLTQDPGSA